MPRTYSFDISQRRPPEPEQVLRPSFKLSLRRGTTLANFRAVVRSSRLNRGVPARTISRIMTAAPSSLAAGVSTLPPPAVDDAQTPAAPRPSFRRLHAVG